MHLAHCPTLVNCQFGTEGESEGRITEPHAEPHAAPPAPRSEMQSFISPVTKAILVALFIFAILLILNNRSARTLVPRSRVTKEPVWGLITVGQILKECKRAHGPRSDGSWISESMALSPFSRGAKAGSARALGDWGRGRPAWPGQGDDITALRPPPEPRKRLAANNTAVPDGHGRINTTSQRSQK
ncbi:unnamed protein product [Gadus morhua 'NCC']